MPRRQLLGPLGEHPLRTRRFPAPVPALPPDDQQRPVPHRQILDPHLPHVIRLAAGQHPAPRAGVLGGDLHHHDPPHPQRRHLNRHHPEPRQVEQQRRSVTHRWPPARSTEDIDQRGRPPPHQRITTRRRSTFAVKSRVRSRRGKLHRLWRRATATLSLLVLLVSLGGYAVLTYFDGRIGRVHLWFAGGRPGEQAGVSNWLLVGTDSRAGTGREYNSTGLAGADNNSDTQILAHVAADGTTTLVSFPRDTYVPIPGYTDKRGVTHPAHRDKMNSALPAGGPSLLVQTVEGLTGLRVDHYVSVNLAGFKAMTDALGGVQVCLTASPYVETGVDDTGRPYRATNLDDPFSQFHARAGMARLDGEQALAFVRQRHGFPDGDLSRIRRQHAFLAAITRSLTGSRLLSDPLALERLLTAATGALTVDDHTSLTDMRQLAERLRGLDPGNVRFETIPTHSPQPGEQGADRHGFIDGKSVLVYDPSQLADFLRPLVDAGRQPAQADSSP